jgi:hypothetical protein
MKNETCILLGQELNAKSYNGERLFYSTYYHEFVKIYQLTSEHFICETCFRKHDKITKGFMRFDSLVLCRDHVRPMIAINQKVIAAVSGTYNDKVSKEIDEIADRVCDELGLPNVE